MTTNSLCNKNYKCNHSKKLAIVLFTVFKVCHIIIIQRKIIPKILNENDASIL